MRAVNLIPADARGRGASATGGSLPVYAVLGGLALLLVFVTIYVLAGNTISDRQAKLATLQAETSKEQAQASDLSKYGQFASLAQTREQTVRQIASTRFDWPDALSDLAKVVPANTSLQSLAATVAPGASAGGTGASSGGANAGLRGALGAPAFDLTGCTATHDDVARLMSRLRLVRGVSRVTLGSSQKSDLAQAGTRVSAGSAGGSSASQGQGCGPNAPTFDILVFFNPVPGAGATGATSLSAPTNGSTPAAGAAAASSATANSTGGAK